MPGLIKSLVVLAIVVYLYDKFMVKQSPIDFKLNDRIGSNELSDQIIDSAQHIFGEQLAQDLVQQLLMTGKMTEFNVLVAHRVYKDAVHLMDSWIKAFENLILLTDVQEERQFLQSSIDGMNSAFNLWTKAFETIFGKVDTSLLNTPITQSVYSYKMHILYHTSQGPFLRGLVTMLPAFTIFHRKQTYLEQNVNYVENDFTKMLCFGDWQLDLALPKLRQMIDRRTGQVSIEERKILSDLFQRSVAYETLLDKDAYPDNIWFS